MNKVIFETVVHLAFSQREKPPFIRRIKSKVGGRRAHFQRYHAVLFTPASYFLFLIFRLQSSTLTLLNHTRELMETLGRE